VIFLLDSIALKNKSQCVYNNKLIPKITGQLAISKILILVLFAFKKLNKGIFEIA